MKLNNLELIVYNIIFNMTFGRGYFSIIRIIIITLKYKLLLSNMN